MISIREARAAFESGLDMGNVADALVASKGLTHAEQVILGLTHLREVLEHTEVVGYISRVSILIAIVNDIFAENGGRIRIHWVAE